ncbi:aminotransferase class IV family protein [Candidatus Microgenomates bacterium]|nr:aminotransferase class IV family protein [Candidatus Microgenomates bacterium]
MDNKREQYVILNGQLILKKDANISVFSRSMFFDFAVYDSMKVVKGRAFFPRFHAERLLESARLINMRHNLTVEKIESAIDLLIEKNHLENAMIRFLLLGPENDQEEAKLYMFSVGLTFYNDSAYRQGVKAITFHGERHIPQAKSKDLLINYLGFREATENGALDALLIDHDGQIREGTRTNFFAVREGKIYTAPLTQVLEGITRKIVVDLARNNDIEVIEKAPLFDELDSFEEFFFTSTSMNVMPISDIDGTIKKHAPGPITKKIMDLYKEYYNENIFGKIETKED